MPSLEDLIIENINQTMCGRYTNYRDEAVTVWKDAVDRAESDSNRARPWLNDVGRRERLNWIDKRSSYCIATNLERMSAINWKLPDC